MPTFTSAIVDLFARLQAWLTDVLDRISEHKVNRIEELLPWRYAGPA
ncbi:transposase domain-containing protein [Alphaproteobacteria bacterium]|nr:transposase domain-containing protein [Alphaproteobacteria bacterium]